MPTPATQEGPPPPSKGIPGLIEIDEVAYRAMDPAERAELDRELQALERLIAANPLNAYRPHPKQQRFHEAKQRTRILTGGNRSGKTTSGAADDLIQVLPPEFVPEHLLPYKKYGHDTPASIRVITPDLSDTLDLVLEKYQEMCPQKALKGGSWDKAYDKVKRNLHFARGDRINFMSTEQHPNKFGGRALHRVHFDEEPAGPNSWRIYRESRMRLIDYGGDMVFSMTPLMQSDWVEDKVWNRRHSDPERVFGVQISIYDNPHLSPAEIAEALGDDMSKEERQAVEHGHFTHFAGKFFDEFSDLHKISPPDLKEVKAADEIVVGIDPGRQTGIVWVAFGRDNEATVFAELYPFDEVVSDIVPQIQAVNKAWGVDDPIYVIDPNAAARTGPNRESFESAYMREGITARSGQNARGPSILEIKRRLQSSPPSLLVNEECQHLLWEIPRYRRDPAKSDEFEAVKKNDHLVDALRYAVMERSWFTPEPQKAPRESRSPFEYQPPYEAPSQAVGPLGSFS